MALNAMVNHVDEPRAADRATTVLKNPVTAACLNFFLPGFGLGYAFPHPVPLLVNLGVTILLFQALYEELGLMAWMVLAIPNAMFAFVAVTIQGPPVRPAGLEPDEANDERPPQLKSPMGAAWFSFLLPGFGLAYVFDHLLWALPNFAIVVFIFAMLGNRLQTSPGTAWLISATANAILAFVAAVYAIRKQMAARPAGRRIPEMKWPAHALLLNAFFPGVGVEYVLGARVVADLPGWEWGLVNFLVWLALLIGGASFFVLMIMNGLLALVLFAVFPPPRAAIELEHRSLAGDGPVRAHTSAMRW
ncbi:MAG: hypothetical protein AB7K24_18160 [Gemmataceae bacterium]